MRKRRYGNNRYKCATGDAEKGAALEGLADGYRGTELLNGYQVSHLSFFSYFYFVKGVKEMSYNMKDLTGEKFGRLTVIRSEGKNRHGSYMWLCECDCGNTKVLNGSELRRGNVNSCGCLSRELARDRLVKHGCSRTKLYSEWKRMNQRCNDTKTYNSVKYTQRGIKVFEPWIDDFQSFSEYVSHLPHFEEPGYSLDRIDNDGNYEPGNVRWANAITQANNRTTNVLITYNSETHTVAEWARILGMSYSKLQWRLHSGWPIEKALRDE